MERGKGVPSERTPEDFFLRRHSPAQNSCEFQFLASHKLVAGYLHLSPPPPPPSCEGGIGVSLRSRSDRSQVAARSSGSRFEPRLCRPDSGEASRSRRPIRVLP